METFHRGQQLGSGDLLFHVENSDEVRVTFTLFDANNQQLGGSREPHLVGEENEYLSFCPGILIPSDAVLGLYRIRWESRNGTATYDTLQTFAVVEVDNPQALDPDIVSLIEAIEIPRIVTCDLKVIRNSSVESYNFQLSSSGWRDALAPLWDRTLANLGAETEAVLYVQVYSRAGGQLYFQQSVRRSGPSLCEIWSTPRVL